LRGERSSTSQEIDTGTPRTLLAHTRSLSATPPTFDPDKVCTGYEMSRQAVLELSDEDAAAFGLRAGYFILDLAPANVMNLVHESRATQDNDGDGR
jgi:hypothetical protein